MKRFLPILLTFSLQAAAQAPAPKPQPPATPTAPQPPERKAEGEKPLILNLKLDDASRHRIMSGSTEERTGGAPLPSLGGDARNYGSLQGDPYPKSSDNLP
jgi:hypothetical protein